jgi:hypothetical protein
MGASNSSTTATKAEDRRDSGPRHNISGVAVREDDIESVKGIRRIATLFRGMSVLLLVLMAVRVFFAFTSTVPASPGIVFAESVRLIIFAGMLWGFGDLAVLAIKSHYDLRATRILNARIAYSLQQMAGGEDSPKPDRAE